MSGKGSTQLLVEPTTWLYFCSAAQLATSSQFCSFKFKMLVLFETPAGYAIFKMLDEGKLQKSDDLYKDFETPEAASKV